MDWARDNAGVNERDLDNVFKYEEKPTTVVRMLRPEIWSLEGKSEWDDWIHNELPQIDKTTSGLVVILAKRTGERQFGAVKKVQSNDWLERLNAEIPGRSNTQRSLELGLMTGKGTIGSRTLGGRRSVRTLPFSKDVFRLVTRKFYTHSSISRAISRADIPVFSNAEIEMGEPDGPTYPAYVYNCRTTNAWAMDLALTATYFPHCNMTFAIIFGCPLSVEEEIIKRLSIAMAEAAHPLLMLGIFAEIERSRHVHIVESTIDELETRIFELDMPDSEAEAAEKRKQQKRSAWLDTTYLRNALVSWNTQLGKMSEHADELTTTVFKPGMSQEDFATARTESEDYKLDIPAGEDKPNRLSLAKSKAHKTYITIGEDKPSNLTLAGQSEPADTPCDEWVELDRDEQDQDQQSFWEEDAPEMVPINRGKAMQSRKSQKKYERPVPHQDPRTANRQTRHADHER
ncbi:hypothetical protein B0J14DRAFT_570895 [Halenospora varia]|nr:hypothetical protein B0J14DRAFT_570895 [Halenospora varia]